jgi:hypothetical protein
MKNRKRIQLSKNFYADEFLPKAMYEKYPDWMIIRRIPPHVVALMQAVRDRHGARTINNWWHGGDRDQSGLRLPGQSYYKEMASHSWCGAVDSIGITPVEEIWEDMEKNYTEVWQPLGLTAIEIGLSITWLHADTGNFSLLNDYTENELYKIKVGNQK